MVKAIIMSGYGINCEEESKYAFELAGATATIVHINDLILGKDKLSNYDIMMFPGGFSYGDDTGSGNAFANRIRNNLWEDVLQFVSDGKLILGICNGFQIMTHLGLFTLTEEETPSKRIHSMEANDHNRYECRWVTVRGESSKCVFTENVDITHLPIAHGEGRFYCSDEVLEKLEDNDQVVFRYCSKFGKRPQGKFPINPNGAKGDVAGICDATGRIMGMMPHPERGLFSVSEPEYHLKKEKALRDGKTYPELIESNLKIFKNAVKYFDK